MGSRFEIGACYDLGAFDPSLKDCGVEAWVDASDGMVDWLVLMEDRSPDFFHGYRGFDPQANVPLNRHGPRPDRWTMADAKRLVDALRGEGVKVFLGYWQHECEWVDEVHPEVLIRGADGGLWQNKKEKNADFNPMRRLRADEAQGIEEGERYHLWAARRWKEIADDFGFDGLFLGDGGMGFRRHGRDWKDLRHFDFHDAWLEEFQDDPAFAPHAGCAIRNPEATTAEKAQDVLQNHWAHWVDWNTNRWTGYYRDTAKAVHAAGGELAAYNCMNYDPAQARLHGVDYRGIAQAGLDILVFQTYDYAWGPHGPFGFLGIQKKDLQTNLRALALTRAAMGFDTDTRIVFTTETEDEVEHWDAPMSHTLGEAYAYGGATAFDGKTWRRAVDGTFIVWGNSVPRDEWRHLGACYRHLEQPPAPPAAALVINDGFERALEGSVKALGPQESEDLYAHLDRHDTTGHGEPTGVVRRADLDAARHAGRQVTGAPRVRRKA